MSDKPTKLQFNAKEHAYWLNGKRCKGASSLGKCLEDTRRLEQYDMRMVAIGVAQNSHVAEAVLDNTADEAKQQLNDICLEAKRLAGAWVKADRGTEVHGATEDADQGKPIHPSMVDHIVGWKAALDAAGLDVVEEYIERIVCWPEYLIAGTFDRIARRRSDGRLVMLDLKTGANAIKYPHSVVVQLAAYTHAPWLAGPLDAKGVTTVFEPMPAIDTEVGYVVSLTEDASGITVRVVEVNLSAGLDAIKSLVMPVHDWRKRKDLIMGNEHVATIAKKQPSDDDRTLEDLIEATNPVRPDNKRREALAARVRVIQEAGHLLDLKAAWPEAVPGFKGAHVHTAAQLDAIEVALWSVEKKHKMAFPPDDDERLAAPLVVAGVAVTAAPVEAPTDTPVAPDEGDALSEDEIGSIKAVLSVLAPERMAWITPITVDARQRGYSLAVSKHPTRRRFAIANALIALSQFHAEPDMVRAVLAHCMGTEMSKMPGVALIDLVLALTIEEATNVHQVANSPDLKIVVDGDGVKVAA